MRRGDLVGVAGAILIVVGIVTLLGTRTAASPPVAFPDPTSPPIQGSSDPVRPSGQPCRPTLQAEVDAAPGGATLDLRGCVYAAGATISRPLTLLGATVRVPAGGVGITVAADDVTLDGITVTGTQSASYVFEEVGVYVGATPSSPVRRLTIRDSRIASLGGFGAYLRNVADVRLERNQVSDVVYAGLMVLSGAGGTIEDNVVRRIGVEGAEANGGNAYGIALTTQGDEPPTVDFLVRGNTVEDVPTWHALDTHGGRRIVFEENTVRRSMRAIFITSDGAGNFPTDIAILRNQLLSPAPIATNLAAVTLYHADVVAVVGNAATGWGKNRFLVDFENLSTRVVVEDNAIEH